MPLFLIDPPPLLYYALAIIALIGLFNFYRYQTRKSLIWFVVWSLPLAALWVIDFTHESPREELVRKIQAIAQATRDHQIPEGFKYLSDSISYRGHNKASLQNAAATAYQQYEWKGAIVWDFTREEFQQIDDSHASQGFMAKLADDALGVTLYCKASFQKEKDGEYRIVDFKFYNPLNRDKGGEETIPGL